IIAGGQSAMHTYELRVPAVGNEDEAQDYWKEILEGEKGLEKPYPFYYHHNNSPHSIGHFYLAPMPFCCGAVVVGGVFLRQDYRGTMVSRKFREMRDDLIKSLGYSMAVATTVTADPA